MKQDDIRGNIRNNRGYHSVFNGTSARHIPPSPETEDFCIRQAACQNNRQTDEAEEDVLDHLWIEGGMKRSNVDNLLTRD